MGIPEKNSYARFSAAFVFCFFMGLVFVGMPQPFGIFGKVVIYSTALSFLFFAVLHRFALSSYVLLVSIPLLLWVLVRSDNVHGVLLFFQILLVFCCAFFRYDFSSYNKFFSAVAQRMVSLFLLLLVAGSYLGFKVFVNPNYLGFVCVCFYILYLMADQEKASGLLGFAFYFSMAALTFSKSSALAIVVIYFCVIMLPRVNGFFFSIGFVFFVAWCGFLIDDLLVFDFYALDSYFLDVTGKRFETGRIELWSEVLSSMNFTQLLVGMGGGVHEAALETGEGILSPHSTYIYMVMCYGLVGLTFFLLTVLALVFRLWRQGQYVFVACATGLLFRDFFETSVVHNNFAASFLFWCFLLCWSIQAKRGSLISSNS